MLAWEIARKWQSENCMTPFEEILGWHLSGGLVYATREVFLLAQEVTWDPVSREILQPSAFSLQPSPNAWFTELAAASPTAQQSNSPIAEFLRVAPHPHEFVLWYRAARNRPHNIHAYKWDHLARRVNLSPSPLCASAPLRENL